MFSYESFYKLYNDRTAGKYQEQVDHFEAFANDHHSGRIHGFRERMLHESRKFSAYLLKALKQENHMNADFLENASRKELEAVQEALFPQAWTADSKESYWNLREYVKDPSDPNYPFQELLHLSFFESGFDAFRHRRFMLIERMEFFFELHKLLMHGQVSPETLSEALRGFELRASQKKADLYFQHFFNLNDRYLTETLLSEEITSPYLPLLMGLPVTDQSGILCRQSSLLSEEVVVRWAKKAVSEFLSSMDYESRQTHHVVRLSYPLGFERGALAVYQELLSQNMDVFIGDVFIPSGGKKILLDPSEEARRTVWNEELEDAFIERLESLYEDNESLLLAFAGEMRLVPYDPMDGSLDPLALPLSDTLLLTASVELRKKAKESLMSGGGRISSPYPLAAQIYIPQTTDDEFFVQLMNSRA